MNQAAGLSAMNLGSAGFGESHVVTDTVFPHGFNQRYATWWPARKKDKLFRRVSCDLHSLLGVRKGIISIVGKILNWLSGNSFTPSSLSLVISVCIYFSCRVSTYYYLFIYVSAFIWIIYSLYTGGCPVDSVGCFNHAIGQLLVQWSTGVIVGSTEVAGHHQPLDSLFGHQAVIPLETNAHSKSICECCGCSVLLRLSPWRGNRFCLCRTLCRSTEKRGSAVGLQCLQGFFWAMKDTLAVVSVNHFWE